MTNSSSRKFWDNKLVRIILAVLGSVLLWVFVTMTEGDLIKQPFNGVRVVFEGADALRAEKDLVITEISSTTVSVTLSGTRGQLASLSSDQIIAVVDVSKTPVVGKHTTIPTIRFVAGTNTSTISTGDITVSPSTIVYSIVREVPRTIEVKGAFTGSVAEGYTSNPPVFDVETVIIRGPENEVNKVKYAWVDITRDKLDTTLDYESTYTLLDADMKEVPLGNIELERETVGVVVQVLATKEIPISVDIIDGAGATSENVKITCTPATIMLSGDRELLDSINKISLDTIDLASFSQTYEETYPIQLENGLNNLKGVTEAKVTVQVIGLETKKFNVTNISVVNMTNGYTAEIITETVEVTLRGPAEVLSEIKANNIRIVGDAADLAVVTGEIGLKSKIIIDGFTGVGAIGEYKVYILIE